MIQDVASLHVVLGKSNPIIRGVSVSTQIAGLRRLLYGWESRDEETGTWFRRAAEVGFSRFEEMEVLNAIARA